MNLERMTQLEEEYKQKVFKEHLTEKNNKKENND